MMICQDCQYADEYLLPYWYPHYDPTCLKGHSMNGKLECEDFKLIGRLSR